MFATTHEDISGRGGLRGSQSGISSCILPALSLVLASTAAAVLLAGSGDAVHLFFDRFATQQNCLSTAFGRTFIAMLPLGAALVASLWLAFSWITSGITDLDFGQAARLDALTYMPFSLLLVALLRYVPGIGKTSAPLYLLSSTLTWPLLFLVAVLVLTLKYLMLWKDKTRPAGRLKARLAALDDRKIGWLVFAAAAVTLAIAIPAFNAGWAFGGDEPHYLIVAHSIVEDLDIDIGDDHADGVWRNFTVHEIERPQRFRRAVDGSDIPFHRIGLPLLAAIPYMLAGRLGAVLLIGFFAALTAANTYWLTAKIVPRRGIALFATAWVALTAPNLPLSFLFFTEGPTAAFTLMALNLIVRRDGSPPRLPWLVPLLAWFLPWLHSRGFVTALVISVILIIRMRGRPIAAAALSVFCIPLALTIPLFNLAHYGEFSLLAEMGVDQSAAFDLKYVLPGLGGVFFDQEFGLLLFNPVVLLAAAGLVSLWRRDRRAAVWVVLIIGSCVGPSVLYRMWWGGGSPPGRYYAAVMPLTALPLAALLAGRAGRKWLIPAAGASLCSAAVAIYLMARSEVLISGRTGASAVLQALSAGSFDAVEWWPSWIAGGARAAPLSAALSVAALLTAAIVILMWKGTLRLAGTSPAAGPIAVTLCLAASLTTAALYCHGAEAITGGEPNGFAPISRESDLLFHNRYRHGGFSFVDQAGTLSVDSLPPRSFTVDYLFPREMLAPDEKAPRGRSLPIPPGGRLVPITPKEPLWQGDYRLVLGIRAEEGTPRAKIAILDMADAAREDAQPPAVFETDVPSDRFVEIVTPLRIRDNSAGLWLKFDGPASLRFTHVVLETVELDRLDSWPLPASLFDQVVWRFDDFLLFAPYGSIYTPERPGAFWTRGDSSVTLVVGSKGKFSELRLALRSWPRVRMEIESERGFRSFGFTQPGLFIREGIPVSPREAGGLWLAEVAFRTLGWAVPAVESRDSDDRRRLGAFVRLRTKK